jgi:hypothetical protein
MESNNAKHVTYIVLLIVIILIKTFSLCEVLWLREHFTVVCDLIFCLNTEKLVDDMRVCLQ